MNNMPPTADIATLVTEAQRIGLCTDRQLLALADSRGLDVIAALIESERFRAAWTVAVAQRRWPEAKTLGRAVGLMIWLARRLLPNHPHLRDH